jgi:hypothetical protein
MYRLLWARVAVDFLAAAWVDADSAQRQAITAAAHEIDRLLRRDPANQGESREGTERVMFVPPLGVSYEIDESHRVVRVFQLWRFRRRH